MPLRGLLLTSFFVGSLPFCFVRPFYGVILWIIVAFLNPQAYTWTAFDAFPWAVAVAVPTIAGTLAFNRDFQRLASREVFLILVLWVWFTITTVVSTHTTLFLHHAADTWYHWNLVSKILLMSLLMIPIVNSFERLQVLIIVIACCFGVYVLKSVPFLILTGGSYRLYGPPRSMIADNNDFGLALNMTAPLFYFLARTETKPWMKRAFAFLFVATIPAVFFTYSRGAMIGLIVVMGLIFIQSRNRFALIPVLVLGIVVAISFAPDSWRKRMDPTRPDAVDASARSRLNAWAYARALAADYPVAGGGFATFTPELFQRYAPNVNDIHGPHSVYFQILAEHGYVGLLLYLSLVASCFLASYRLVREARAREDESILIYARMLRLSMIGFLTSGIFLGRAYFDYYFAIVSCMVILQNAAWDRWSDDAEWDEEDQDSPILNPDRAAVSG
jgi:putative inorganic carbon (HCO3(-)) transporter